MHINTYTKHTFLSDITTDRFGRVFLTEEDAESTTGNSPSKCLGDGEAISGSLFVGFVAFETPSTGSLDSSDSKCRGPCGNLS